MPIDNRVGYRSYRRVKNPSNAALGEVVHDSSMASDLMSFSPYSPVVDASGAEPFAKVDMFDDVVQNDYSLPPLGMPVIYDELLGIQLSEEQIWNIFDSLKQGSSVADVALAYEISQNQTSSIYKAILNGAQPYDILHPEQAQFETQSTLPIRTMSDQPISYNDGNMYASMLPGAMMTLQNQQVPIGAGTEADRVASEGFSVSPMMLAVGAVAAIFLLKE